MHRDLVDDSAGESPGRWTLHECLGCASAFLDPRPTRASIFRAYAGYHTHADPCGRQSAADLGPLRRIRRGLANAYTNARFGTRYAPGFAAGAWLARLAGPLRERLDVQFRWLPRPRPGQRLLDVGCGNAEFVARANDAGWQAMGVDFDRTASAAARLRGLDVLTGSMDLLVDRPGYFDAITLSHVLEHVHSPPEFLRTAHALLKPGGTLYIDTPNLHGRGARRFGPAWRGLEPPRHLSLFHQGSLVALLQRSGFGEVRLHRRCAVSRGMFECSERIRRGLPPDAAVSLGLASRLWLWWPFKRTARLEFITLSARRDEA